MNYGQNTRPTSGFSIPVETGNEYMVDITETGKGRDGIARIGGRVIFVRGARSGAKNIKIKINSVDIGFATAKVTADPTDTT